MSFNKTYASLLFLVFGLIFAGVSAQNIEEPDDLVTDRPDQTESSISVPLHTLQIETGFTYTYNSQQLNTEKEVNYGDTLLRFGIFEGMELRMAMDYSTVKTYVTDFPAIAVMQQGVSPTTLGAKINLTEQKGWIPEMALLVHVQTSLFNTDFSTDYAVPQLIFVASHTLSSKFSLGYNLGIEWTDNDAAPAKIYSLVAGIGLAERIGIFAETFGNFGDGEFVNMVDGGFTFLILPNLQYDISGGIGVTSSSPDFFIGTGLSYRLPH